MGALGGIIDNVVGAVADTKHGTTLQDFLATFSSSNGALAKTIDPFSTFDVSMKFYPNPDWKAAASSSNDKGWAERLGDSLVSSAKGAVKSAANNLTGGLVGAAMNSKVDIQKLHSENEGAISMQSTFMEFLASANLIVGQEDWIGEKAGQSVKPLELQLGPYCQEIVLPNLEVPQSGTSNAIFGEFPIQGTFVKSDNNVLLMKIVNTKAPLHERIFYPWLRETVSQHWCYNEQPYTTATIAIDFTKHCDLKYMFYGCRPQKINLIQPTQDATATLTRDVSFLFDYMTIQSSLKVSESIKDKLLGTGGSLVNSAAKMLNM